MTGETPVEEREDREDKKDKKEEISNFILKVLTLNGLWCQNRNPRPSLKDLSIFHFFMKMHEIFFVSKWMLRQLGIIF